MEANDLPITEMTLTGWINADLFVTGIRAAGGDKPAMSSTRSRSSTAINALTYDAGGILPEFAWREELHKSSPINCYRAYEKVDGATKTFIPESPPTSPSRGCASTRTRRSSSTAFF